MVDFEDHKAKKDHEIMKPLVEMATEGELSMEDVEAKANERVSSIQSTGEKTVAEGGRLLVDTMNAGKGLGLSEEVVQQVSEELTVSEDLQSIGERATELTIVAKEKIDKVVLSSEKAGDIDPERTEQYLQTLLGGDLSVENLNRINPEYQSEIMLKLIEIILSESSSIQSQAGAAAEFCFAHFENLNKQVALKFIEHGETEYLSRFKNLDKEVALKLIDGGKVYALAFNLASFTDLDDEVFRKFAKQAPDYCSAQNLSNLRDLDHNTLALDLIATGKSSLVGENIASFKDANRDLVHKLIEAGEGSVVARNLSSFESIDTNKLAIDLIEAGNALEVGIHLKHCKDLDQEVAIKLIEADQGRFVVESLSSFRSLNHEEIAIKLVDSNCGFLVAKAISKLDHLDCNKLILKLIGLRYGEYLAEGLSSLSGLNQEVALKLIETKQGQAVAKNLSSFRDLGQEVALNLIELDLAVSVAQNLSSFVDLDREDMYKRATTSAQVSMVAAGLVDESLIEENIRVAAKLKKINLKITKVSEKEMTKTADMLNAVTKDPLEEVDFSRELTEQEMNGAHAELLKVFNANISKSDRVEYLQKCKETGVKDPYEPNRLLKIMLDLDINNGETRVARYMQQSDTPDRIWAYFAKKLVAKEYLTKNVNRYLKDVKDNSNTVSFQVVRKLLAQSPMDFNTVIDTAVSLDIVDLAGEEKTLLSAMKDFGGVTPEVYKQYKKLQGQERDDFVEKIKGLKSRFFGNTPIDQLGVDDAIVNEVLYLSYKPTNTSLEGVKVYLDKVPDCTEQLASYTFPQDGYVVEMNDVDVKLRPESKLKFNFDEFSSLLKQREDISEKDIKQTLLWMAKGSTSPTKEQLGTIIRFLPQGDRERLITQMKETKTDKDTFAALNSAVDFLGIFAKDNLPKTLQEHLDKNEELKTLLNSTLGQEKYSKVLKARLGEGYTEYDTERNLSKLAVGLLQVEQQKARKDIKSFVRVDGSSATENSDKYKIYLSKNKASFFAKASGGICTANDIELFRMENHLHFNMVRNDEIVLGNIQGYTHADTTGKKMLILRGFNPSESALKEFSAESFVEAGLKVGRAFVKDNGFDSFAIVYDGGWHPLSNRDQVRQYLSRQYGNSGERVEIPTLLLSPAQSQSINEVRVLSV